MYVYLQVYVIREINGKETPRALLYVGLTSQMELRFDAHRNRGTFAKHDRVERAILKEGMTKGAAEFLEATLIMSSRPTDPLLNTSTEYRHLLNNIEDGPQFAAEVRHWHKLAVHMLCAQWSKLDWEEWRPLRDENEKEGTRKRG
jgi:predicted GIY-YIG superfamily endonuclease